MLLLVLGIPTAASAQVEGLGRNPVTLESQSVAELANELRSERRSDRLYAARELRRQVKSAAKRTGRSDEAVAQVARVELHDLRQDLGDSATIAVVEHRNVRPVLADLLRWLGDPGAVQALTEARRVEDRRRVDRKLDRAIDALEGA